MRSYTERYKDHLTKNKTFLENLRSEDEIILMQVQAMYVIADELRSINDTLKRIKQ